MPDLSAVQLLGINYKRKIWKGTHGFHQVRIRISDAQFHGIVLYPCLHATELTPFIMLSSMKYEIYSISAKRSFHVSNVIHATCIVNKVIRVSIEYVMT